MNCKLCGLPNPFNNPYFFCKPVVETVVPETVEQFKKDLDRITGIDAAKLGSDITARHMIWYDGNKMQIRPISDEEFYADFEKSKDI